MEVLTIQEIIGFWTKKEYFLGSAKLAVRDDCRCLTCVERGGRATEAEAENRPYDDCYLLEMAGVILEGPEGQNAIEFAERVVIQPGDEILAKDFLVMAARTGENKCQKVFALKGLSQRSDILSSEEFGEMRQLAIKLGLSPRINFARGC